MKKTIQFISFFLIISFFHQPLISQNKNQKTTVRVSVKDSKNRPVKDAVFYIDDVKTEVRNSNGVYKLKVNPQTKLIKAFSYSNGVVETKFNGQKKINLVFPNLYVPKSQNIVQTNEGNNSDYNSIYDIIRAKVPGVRVQSNNKIIIRGIGTFNSSSDPLLIVNGAPVSSIDNIPPVLVKTISALKGPEAAIYGVRGANGVLLITLKKKI